MMSALLFLGRDTRIFSSSAGETESLAQMFDLIRIENQRERMAREIDELGFLSFCVYEPQRCTTSGYWVLPAPRS
jgi:hypothetical protein